MYKVYSKNEWNMFSNFASLLEYVKDNLGEDVFHIICDEIEDLKYQLEEVRNNTL